MDRRDIEAFVAVAKHLSFSRAAQSLYVSQPALSQRIRKLEIRLGARLFRRSAIGVSLTAAGESLLRRVAGLLDAWEDLDNNPIDRVPERRLSFSVTYDYDGALIEHLVSSTGAHRVVVEVDPTRAQDLVTRGDVDAAYVYSLPPVAGDPGIPIPGRVHVRTVVHEPVWVVVSRTHPLANAEMVSLDDINESGTAWLVAAPHEPMHAWEAALLATASRAPRVVTSSGNLLLMAERGLVAGLGSPSGGPSSAARIALPLTPQTMIHHVLAWRSDRLSDRDALEALAALRAFHRRRAQLNPRYWNYINSNKSLFPGVAL